MPKITYLTPFYRNGGMFKEQIKWIEETWEPSLRGQVEYIVVDDGSPENTLEEAIEECEFLNHWTGFSAYRIKKDLPWNHIAARNIAVHHSRGDWLMMTDMDHRVPANTFWWLLNAIELNPPIVKDDKFYTFDRVDAPDLTPYKSHPHTWFMSRKLWDKFGGYDERFSGHYGMDFLARERLLHVAEMGHLDGVQVVRYPREVIPDASTTVYPRKSTEDRAFVKELRTQLKHEGSYFKPLTLTFEYERIR